MNGSVNEDAPDLAAAAAGNEEAFARLYDRHAPVVLSLCRGRVFADAEDATQETFLRASLRLDRLSDPSRLRPWLYAIARRVCSERLRARRRRAHHEEHAAMLTTANHVLPPASADHAEHAEQLECLDRAMGQLEDQERLAVHLYYLEADPVRAASLALGLSRSGYYKLLARARQRLSALMGQGQPS